MVLPHDWPKSEQSLWKNSTLVRRVKLASPYYVYCGINEKQKSYHFHNVDSAGSGRQACL